MINKSKRWFESKTMWIGILEITVGALGLLGAFLEIGNFTPAALTLLIAGILTVILRKVTELPIG